MECLHDNRDAILVGTVSDLADLFLTAIATGMKPLIRPSTQMSPKCDIWVLVWATGSLSGPGPGKAGSAELPLQIVFQFVSPTTITSVLYAVPLRSQALHWH